MGCKSWLEGMEDVCTRIRPAMSRNEETPCLRRRISGKPQGIELVVLQDIVGGICCSDLLSSPAWCWLHN